MPNGEAWTQHLILYAQFYVGINKSGHVSIFVIKKAFTYREEEIRECFSLSSSMFFIDEKDPLKERDKKFFIKD